MARSKIQAGFIGQLLLIVALGMLGTGCSSWAGNPDDDDEPSPDGNTPVPPGGGSTTVNVAVEPGNSMQQRFTLKAGSAFSSTLSAFSLLTGNDVDQSGPIELSVVRADGGEVVYDRSGVSDSSVSYTPDEDGEYIVTIKNNTTTTLSDVSTAISGAESVGPLINASARRGATAGVTMKAVVVFARTCKQYADGGNSIQSFDPPAGEYFVQPFVFLGQVGADKKVTPISTATIAIKQGGKVLTLSKLSDFDLSVYREVSGMTKDQHAAYTRTFYQGYFGAAGEMYTTDTFLFGGDCSKATTFPIGEDAGQSLVDLDVDFTVGDSPVSSTFPVRPTIGPAFSMYTSADEKLADYTQCTYDRTTGDPVTYNGDAMTCKEFSIKNGPYVTLDYLLPSAADPAKISPASDPTRIVFYGHSFPKEWYNSLVQNSDGLLNGTITDLSLPRCLNNGGMVSVPVSTDKTYLPLSEFNVGAGDVVNLARRPGSYTSLTDFYQGDVDMSGTIEYTTCIPKGDSSCEGYKTLNVILNDCKYKADSGVTAMAISDSFIYPSYFEMSGIITE